jgi:sorbitol-specific phosphotransferase system component IIBC
MPHISINEGVRGFGAAKTGNLNINITSAAKRMHIATMRITPICGETASLSGVREVNIQR